MVRTCIANKPYSFFPACLFAVDAEGGGEPVGEEGGEPVEEGGGEPDEEGGGEPVEEGEDDLLHGA